MHRSETACSAIIPAAGISGRMGRDKIFLPAGAGVTFAGHLINGFVGYGCSPVVLVVNDQTDTSQLNHDELLIEVNHHVNLGRNHSIELAIRHVPPGFGCFIQNVDNPFIEDGLLDKLVRATVPDGYAVPVYRGKGGHPIALGREVVEFLREQEGLPDLRQVLQKFSMAEVPYPDERVLWNINTPEDYDNFTRWNRV